MLPTLEGLTNVVKITKQIMHKAHYDSNLCHKRSMEDVSLTCTFQHDFSRTGLGCLVTNGYKSSLWTTFDYGETSGHL